MNPAARFDPGTRWTQLLLRFCQQHELPARSLRTDGVLTFTVDRKYRIRAIPAPGNRLALECVLMELPDGPDAQTDEMLLQLAHTAAGLLKDYASTLAIDTRRQTLVVQQVMDAGTDIGAFRQVIAEFVNAVAFWQRMCTEIAARNSKGYVR